VVAALQVHLLNRQRKLKVDSRRLRTWVRAVLQAERPTLAGEVEIVLLRDAGIARLNARYRGRPRPTDVLAFPADRGGWPPEAPPPIGTVVVSVERAIEQARERRLAVAEELDRLVVHGLLHLLGYRDDSPAARARMRRRENRYLRSQRQRG
jgi:probable rRNA maturation factor